VALRHRRRVVFGVATGVLVVAHVLAGTVGVAAAARWLGGIAVAVSATVLVALHVVAVRRLAGRRRVREVHRDGGLRRSPPEAGA
jgi:putative Ca2+/H+ antiporter (TMEM165/GDT1 family)